MHNAMAGADGTAVPATAVPAPNPYYPPGLAVPNYAPNTTPLPLLVLGFGAALGASVAAAVAVARRVRPAFGRAPRSAQALFAWFTLCGGLHCFFESYFVFHHASIAGQQTVLAQLWKVYALSDSRYMVSDPFMLCVESVTAAVLGPLAFATAAAIAHAPEGQAGLRHVLQIFVSTAHLYGVVLYYGTLAFEVAVRGTSHCRPEFVYFWVFFVGFNAPWVVVPAYILKDSIGKVGSAFAKASQLADASDDGPLVSGQKKTQ